MEADSGYAHQCVSVITPRGALKTVIEDLGARVAMLTRVNNPGLTVDPSREDDEAELFSGSSTIYVTTLARICGRDDLAEALQIAYDAGIDRSEIGVILSEMISLRNILCGGCLLIYCRYCVVDYLCASLSTV
jgi:hypothetical protein